MGLRGLLFDCLGGTPKKDDKVPCLPLELFVNNVFFGMFAVLHRQVARSPLRCCLYVFLHCVLETILAKL